MRFSDLLTKRLSHDPGNPLITFYDEDTGERTELSATTYANWVAKTANVLIEEFDIEPGQSLAITLGPHWLTPVFLGAIWLNGSVNVSSSDDPDLLIGGPEVAVDPDALACSRHPFALPFPDQIAATDFGTAWPNQPDVFLGDPASSSQLEERVLRSERIITDLDHATDPQDLIDVLIGGGSLVIVRNPRNETWASRMEAERATESIRAGQA
jgi:uncharacterized protein (TIGR03089 family)